MNFGDKTQLLVLSFSSKSRVYKILLGVAIGSFFSHGIAILFGSSITLFENPIIHSVLKWITYISFIIMGIISFLPKKETLHMENNKIEGILFKISHLKLNYCFIIALCFAVGEIGDKTFLASMGLGILYPNYILSLIFGAIFAMVVCDFLAILCGKFLKKYISEKAMQKFSGILFFLFGILGFLSL